MKVLILGNALFLLAFIFFWIISILPKKWMMNISKLISLIFFALSAYTLGSMAGVSSELILMFFLILTVIKEAICDHRPYARKPNKYRDAIIDRILTVIMLVLFTIQISLGFLQYENYGTIFLLLCNGSIMIGEWFLDEQKIRYVKAFAAISYIIYSYTILGYSAIFCGVIEIFVSAAAIMTYDKNYKEIKDKVLHKDNN